MINLNDLNIQQKIKTKVNRLLLICLLTEYDNIGIYVFLIFNLIFNHTRTHNSAVRTCNLQRKSR